MVHLFAVALLLLSQQLDTSIFGTVRDDTGAPLPGAAVSIQNDETGPERKLATDGNGRSRLPRSVVFSAASSSPAPTAGIITSTATTSRRIQFGLKLLLW